MYTISLLKITKKILSLIDEVTKCIISLITIDAGLLFALQLQPGPKQSLMFSLGVLVKYYNIVMNCSSLSSTISSFESSSAYNLNLSPSNSPSLQKTNTNANSNSFKDNSATSPSSNYRIVDIQSEFLSKLESCAMNSIIIIGMLSLRNPEVQQFTLETYYALSRHNSAAIQLPQISANLAISNFNPIEDFPVDPANIINLGNSFILHDLCSLPSKFFTSERFKNYLMPTLISITIDNNASLMLLRKLISLNLIQIYIMRLNRELAENVSENNQVTSAASSVVSLSSGGGSASTTSLLPSSILALSQISHRLPTEMWNLGHVYSDSDAGSHK